MFLARFFFVILDNSVVGAGVIAPRGGKEGRDLTVMITNDFSNKDQLPFRDLVLNRRDVTGAHLDRVVGDVVIDHLGGGDAEYLADAAVK